MLKVFAVYLAVHFLLYAAALRNLAALRSEKGIFLYHFASAVLAALAGATYAALDPAGFGIAGFALVVSIHGIYSLSFLELWSLAQGGYSLSIIAAVANAEADRSMPDFSGLELIGETKQRERLAGLARLRLISTDGGRVALTTRGRRVAAILQWLFAWVHPAQAR